MIGVGKTVKVRAENASIVREKFDRIETNSGQALTDTAPGGGLGAEADMSGATQESIESESSVAGEVKTKSWLRNMQAVLAGSKREKPEPLIER